MNFLKTIKNIWYAIKKLYSYDKKFIFFTLLFSLLETLPVPFMSVLFWKWLFTMIENKESILVIALVLCLFATIEFIMFLATHLYTHFYYTPAVLEIKSKFKLDFYQKIRNTDMIQFENADYYSNYIAAGNQITECYLNIWSLLISFVSSLFIAVSIATLIVSLETFTLFFVVFNVLITSIFTTVKKKLAYNKYLETVEENKSLDYINRVFYMKEYSKDIKCEQLPTLLIQRLQKTYAQLKRITFKYGAKNLKFDGPSIGLLNISNYAMLGIISYKILNGLIMLGEFTALYNGSMQLTSQLKNIISVVPNLYEQNLYLDSVQSFECCESQIECSTGVMVDTSIQPYSISFRNVSFGYPSKKTVLRDISFDIQSGEKIAIVGENGSGKTSLLNVLLRLYDVDSGGIFYNNKNIKEIDVAEYRKMFANVFQNSNLYTASISENISFLNDLEDIDKINSLIRMVGLNNKIDSLPEKINTHIGKEFKSSGVELSGGEKQKIAICRALYKDANILLLDEPNSSLDPKSEYELFRLINEIFNDKTIIMVSHRLATTRDADKIIVLSNGEIIEYGNHQELMNFKGRYYELYELQSSQYSEVK